MPLGSRTGSGWGQRGSTSSKKTYVGSKSSGTVKTRSAPKSSGTIKKPSGGIYSSYDNQYHPPSWYAPKPKPTPVKTHYSSIDNAQHPASWWTSGQAAKAKAAKQSKTAGTNLTGYRQPKSSATKGDIVKGKGYGDKGAVYRKPLPSKSTAVKGAPVAGDKGFGHTPVGGNRYNGGGGGRSGGGGGTGSVPTTPPAAKPPVKAVAKPPVKPKPVVKTKPRSVVGKPQTMHGRGRKARRFKRTRGTGPLSSLSITPEMLSSIARQRIVNYR